MPNRCDGDGAAVNMIIPPEPHRLRRRAPAAPFEGLRSALGERFNLFTGSHLCVTRTEVAKKIRKTKKRRRALCIPLQVRQPFGAHRDEVHFPWDYLPALLRSCKYN